MHTQDGQTGIEQYKQAEPCAVTVGSMHNTAGFVGKEAEGLVVMTMKKYWMFSHLYGYGPQMNHQ